MPKQFGLFEAFGVEIEYMIVDARTFAVLPIADRFLVDEDGVPTQDVESGPVAWSNELALHLLELKEPTPAASLSPVADRFALAVKQANAELAKHGARLMPTGTHPWMNPSKETRLWPHGDQEIYAAYDKIFRCNADGWSNLQSTHLNLPFQGDQEFAQLHTAIRLLLPVLPALSASSPYTAGRFSGFLDSRMEAYRVNSAAIPSVTGHVVPELVESKAQYQQEILEPMYQDIKAQDPEGILQYEWLNARGAIARFDRDAIEIRVLDTQECPRADIAVLQLVTAVLKSLTKQTLSKYQLQASLSTDQLVQVLSSTVRQADEARITDSAYLRSLGLDMTSASTRGIWQELYQRVELDLPAEQRRALELILDKGPLARRMLNAAGRSPRAETLTELAAQLCNCLAENKLFEE